jgi:hypothetical protein
MEERFIKQTPEDVSAEDFCAPYEGKQKQECIFYYEKWFEEEEKKEQVAEKK